MKHKKNSQYTKKFLQIFCVCIFLCILLFSAGKEVTENISVGTEGETGSKSVLELQPVEVTEEESQEESGETVVKITEIAGTPGEDGVVLSEVRYDEIVWDLWSMG